MFSRAEIKAQAKQQLKGNVWMLFLCMVIITAISFAISFAMQINTLFSIIGFIATYVVVPALSLGLTTVYLEVTYGEGVNVPTLFKTFQDSRQWISSVILLILIGIFTFLWSLLFVIPGIIKAFSYSMSYYILAENPDMTAREALNESKAIMHGHKMDLFVLELSFIPWLLLVIVTFGIAAIWVEPYMQLTMTNFYHNIKRQNTQQAYEIPAVDVVE